MIEVRTTDLLLRAQVEGSGAPLFLLHGFTGSHAVWESFVERWKSQYTLIVPDLPGHGASPVPKDAHRCGMSQTVEALLALLEAVGCQEANVLGYSMGGRIALGLAVAAESKVRSLILESASPGLATPEERLARVASDEALARSIEQEGVPSFVARWEGLPLFAGTRRAPLPVQEAQRAIRLRQSADGLAESLRGIGTGAQPSLWEALPSLRVPVLCITGAADDKFTQIGAKMAARMPRGHHVVVEDSGHTPHLEQPDGFCDAVERFLRAEADGNELDRTPTGGNVHDS